MITQPLTNTSLVDPAAMPAPMPIPELVNLLKTGGASLELAVVDRVDCEDDKDHPRVGRTWAFYRVGSEKPKQMSKARAAELLPLLDWTEPVQWATTYDDRPEFDDPEEDWIGRLGSVAEIRKCRKHCWSGRLFTIGDPILLEEDMDERILGASSDDYGASSYWEKTAEGWELVSA